MRIVCFVDDHDQVMWGRELDDRTAEVLAGDLLGGLTATGRKATIHRRLAPLKPVNVFCIGLNYREHARETGAAVPTTPVVFMKPTSTVTDPGGAIRIPACGDPGGEVDYEGELAVVIGRAAHNVAEADALDYVLGYTCANDVSARRWQKQGAGGQWIRGKGFDTFCPLGPVLLTADEVRNPQALPICTTLNGQTVQESSTGDMVFTVAQIISELSRDLTLLPGTVILTGTPQGVGVARKPPLWLKPGDEVTVEIAGIGALTNPVEAATA